MQGARRIAVSPRPYGVTVKRCTKCGEAKSEGEFYAAKGTRDGLRGDCKACHAARAKDWYAKNRQRSIANVARWQRENREHVRAYRRRRNAERRTEIREYTLLRKYGVTLAEYETILASQGGGCAICGDVPEDGRSFHVDHLDDVVRGVLCVRCNNALGQLKEDPELAARALDYLESGGFVPAATYELRDLAHERARALRVT